MLYLILYIQLAKAQVIEWSKFHEEPVLEYQEVFKPSDCSKDFFSQTVPLPSNRDTLDLQDWFKPGFAYRMRVSGKSSKSAAHCFFIGSQDFHYFEYAGE